MTKNKRIESRDHLMTICEKKMEEKGTLRTNGLALDIDIKRQVDKCYSMGVTVVEVRTILMKFGQFLD